MKDGNLSVSKTLACPTAKCSLSPTSRDKKGLASEALSIKGEVAILNYRKAWKNMIDESSNKESTSPEKLLIDNQSDFQFHAAYLTYSNTYDKITNPETKKQLNQNIRALQQNQIDYPTFYKNINQYRTEDESRYNHGRIIIKTQRKRDWRRKTQRHERIERHKK
jgi:hypothetical protein